MQTVVCRIRPDRATHLWMSEPVRAKTLPGLLAEAAQNNRNALAFRYRDEQLTFGDWDELASRLAGALAASGVGRGDVVALLLPTTPLYQIAYLAIGRLGAIATGINLRYRRTEIQHILEVSGASLLLGIDESHGTNLRAMIEGLPREGPDLKTLWISPAALASSTRSVVEELTAKTKPYTEIDARGDEPATIVFTSGTTGIPKGAWYAHENLMALAEIERRRHASGHPAPTHLVTGISFAHVGFMARAAIPISHQTCTLIHDSFDPGAVLEAIERERLTDIGGFPTQVVMLMDHPDCPGRDLSSVETVLLGGAPSTPALIRRVCDVFGARVSVRYSSTEMGIGSASLPDDPPEILATTVGKPTRGVEMRIAGEKGEPVQPGEWGEVLVRSAASMRGYWRNEEATRKTVDDEGFIHTGDIGSIDEAGYLRLRGRQSEMFIRGGFNVYPVEIESRLGKHPKVARAAVVGRPDDVLGEIGWAFVVPEDAETPPDLETLRLWVGEELASFKRPDGLTLVEDLPTTAMFKVDKKALRGLFED